MNNNQLNSQEQAFTKELFDSILKNKDSKFILDFYIGDNKPFSAYSGESFSATTQLLVNLAQKKYFSDKSSRWFAFSTCKKNNLFLEGKFPTIRAYALNPFYYIHYDKVDEEGNKLNDTPITYEAPNRAYPTYSHYELDKVKQTIKNTIPEAINIKEHFGGYMSIPLYNESQLNSEVIAQLDKDNKFYKNITNKVEPLKTSELNNLMKSLNLKATYDENINYPYFDKESDLIKLPNKEFVNNSALYYALFECISSASISPTRNENMRNSDYYKNIDFNSPREYLTNKLVALCMCNDFGIDVDNYITTINKYSNEKDKALVDYVKQLSTSKSMNSTMKSIYSQVNSRQRNIMNKYNSYLNKLNKELAKQEEERERTLTKTKQRVRVR